jgi:hypothetical protein
VPERILTRPGPDGLRDLAADQPGKRLGLDPDRFRAQVGQYLRGPGEQEVAGEDRDRVVPSGVGAGQAAAHGRLVHYVVVIQGGQVGELDRHRRRDDPLVAGVAELGGQQHERGAEPLAPGGDEVAGSLGQQVMPGLCGLPQAVLDQREAFDDIGGQRGVRQLHGDYGAH